jgi:hypothetical protein
MKIKPAAIMLMTVTVRNAPCNRDLYDCSDLRDFIAIGLTDEPSRRG